MKTPMYVVAAMFTTMLTAGTSSLHATTITATQDPAKFGGLDQGKTNCADLGCGPAAAVNSFVYLQTMFPDTYKTPLVGTTSGTKPTAAEQVDAANALAPKMGCCATKGTLIEDFILGKMEYIESKNKGVTTYTAQDGLAWRPAPSGGSHPGTAKPDFVQDKTNPTLAFIAAELKAGEDVEIFISVFQSQPMKSLGDHALTLTGISFDDTTNTGSVSFVDPLGGTKGSANITGLEQGFIKLDYKAPGVGGDFAVVFAAVAESPIPEPETLAMMLIGCLGLFWYVSSRRQRSSRNPWI
jgi:hypothetical protein